MQEKDLKNKIFNHIQKQIKLYYDVDLHNPYSIRKIKENIKKQFDNYNSKNKNNKIYYEYIKPCFYAGKLEKGKILTISLAPKMNDQNQIKQDQQNYKYYIEQQCQHLPTNPIYQNIYKMLTGNNNINKNNNFQDWLSNNIINVDYCYFYADSGININYMKNNIIINNQSLIDIFNNNLEFLIETLEPKLILMHGQPCKEIYQYLINKKKINNVKPNSVQRNKSNYVSIYGTKWNNKIHFIYFDVLLSPAAGWGKEYLLDIHNNYIKKHL